MHLSATAISKFACPYAYWLYYIQKIRPMEKSESLAIGEGYHACLEKWAQGMDIEDIRQWVSDTYYAERPKRWAQILAGFDARVAHGVNILSDGTPEVRFELDYNGHTVVGVFDLVREFDDSVTIREYKSSGSAFQDATYWTRARRSRQISLYYWAARQLWPGKTIEIFYDVWHKSRSRPKKLTKAETAAWKKSGQYCDTDLRDEEPEMTGKDGDIAIETPAMFYARLYNKYTTEPTFEQQFIPRLGTDNQKVEANLDKLIATLEFMAKNDAWFQNEDQCDAYGGCDYCPICDNYLNPEADDLPDGLIKEEK